MAFFGYVPYTISFSIISLGKQYITVPFFFGLAIIKSILKMSKFYKDLL
jgi:hypothetical protein